MASFDADFRPTERCFDMFQLEGRSKDTQEAALEKTTMRHLLVSLEVAVEAGTPEVAVG